MKNERIRILKQGEEKSGPIIYWMSRDQRTHDNWALLFAQEMAIKQKASLGVAFCLVPQFLGATIRQYGFMLQGLQETEKNLEAKNIPFFLLTGSPEEGIAKFVSQHEVGTLITDFDPLRLKRAWKKGVLNRIDIPVYEVDTHNIVPCWIVSPKQEFAAYTFRPKVKRQLSEFLDEFPKLKKHPFSWKKKVEQTDWSRVKKGLKIDRKVLEVDWIKPGEKAARLMLNQFIEHRLSKYDVKRNDPNIDGQSSLSPYLHFGQISAQRIVLEIQKKSISASEQEAFLEELIVRRELADNFCFYNELYDNFIGFPDWAKKTLNEYRHDRREYIYSLDQFEKGQTHDVLWNAAQKEMVKSGKMHGYLRMYWAKKILEWTETPEEALRIAIFLNDKYELDGRDPNGYVGIAWSIGGVHDRAWFPRPIFGKIRYMSYKGTQSKFDVKAYIKKVNSL
ncbi:MAG: deoxyribodipyrimidine photo-lyase [Nitrospirota bacterium]|nr:deoxyribodipyrimidine photo-lyase [Nitrospirota bacterium]MDH5768508.1 deoxyribodipyrimidine photo-lyase [Nitrospirota bacterium]